jgi:glutathione S-transferase
MMKLYFGPNSPYARKVRVVLAEKGLPFEPAVIDVAAAGPEYARLNPNLRVPCLVDGERALFESNLIVDYLLQTYPDADGAGQPPLAKAMTRPAHHWEDALILSAIETVLDSGLNLFQIARSGVAAAQSTYLQREQNRIHSNLDWLEARLPPDGFVPGTFSIQDLNLTIAWIWLNFRKPLPLQPRPHLDALVARYERRPSLQSTHPPG